MLTCRTAVIPRPRPAFPSASTAHGINISWRNFRQERNQTPPGLRDVVPEPWSQDQRFCYHPLKSAVTSRRGPFRTMGRYGTNSYAPYTHNHPRPAADTPAPAVHPSCSVLEASRGTAGSRLPSSTDGPPLMTSGHQSRIEGPVRHERAHSQALPETRITYVTNISNVTQITYIIRLTHITDITCITHTFHITHIIHITEQGISFQNKTVLPRKDQNRRTHPGLPNTIRRAPYSVSYPSPSLPPRPLVFPVL